MTSTSSSSSWLRAVRFGLALVLMTDRVHSFHVQPYDIVRFGTARSTSPKASLPAMDPRKAEEPEKKEKGMLDFIFNPYESKIPKEIERDIFAAESNTPAAKEREQRIGLYALAAFLGILCAFFNGFLTELRTGSDVESAIDLNDAGFGWVYSNFLFSFIFTNKIGGFLCLLGGGACGLLAEAEYDTKRINSEKIFDEMQRRRAGKEGYLNKKTREQENRRPKRRPGKESKRMSALSELGLEGIESNAAEDIVSTPQSSDSRVEPADSPDIDSKSTAKDELTSSPKSNGVLEKIKGFYEQADSMASTQALLLNKELEDKGLIDKITDETGLRVIGKDAAAKLTKGKNDDHK